MAETIFLAGASGAIGRRLAPLLVADGWRVVGTTRQPDKAKALAALGVEPVVLDVFDAPAVMKAVQAAAPAIVMHQLTDLPPGLDSSLKPDAPQRNARIRDEGTRNLVAAAIAAGARRLIAQSIGFVYAEGPLPHREDDPLDDPVKSVSARGVIALESQVLAAPLVAIVLRYGRLYGPGTGFSAADRSASLHVDAAAQAARLAVTRGEAGLYNVAEDDGTLDSGKAKAALGWSAGFRIAP